MALPQRMLAKRRWVGSHLGTSVRGSGRPEMLSRPRPRGCRCQTHVFASRTSTHTGCVSSQRVQQLHPPRVARQGRCKSCCCGICMGKIMFHSNTNTTTCTGVPVPRCFINKFSKRNFLTAGVQVNTTSEQVGHLEPQEPALPSDQICPMQNPGRVFSSFMNKSFQTVEFPFNLKLNRSLGERGEEREKSLENHEYLASADVRESLTQSHTENVPEPPTPPTGQGHAAPSLPLSKP